MEIRVKSPARFFFFHFSFCYKHEKSGEISLLQSRNKKSSLCFSLEPGFDKSRTIPCFYFLFVADFPCSLFDFRPKIYPDFQFKDKSRTIPCFYYFLFVADFPCSLFDFRPKNTRISISSTLGLTVVRVERTRSLRTSVRRYGAYSYGTFFGFFFKKPGYRKPAYRPKKGYFSSNGRRTALSGLW